MSLLRYLKPGLIRMALETRFDPESLADPDTGVRYGREVKRRVLEEICDLFEAEGAVANRSKLFTDLWNREKKASTALGKGMALPHVRTKQARSFQVGLLRSKEGVWFDAPEGRRVHLFIPMIAPPYEDQQYLKVYRQIGKAMEAYPELVEAVRESDTEEALRRTLKFYFPS